MQIKNDFDRFFLNLPPLNKEDDFDFFWKSSLDELKKINPEPLFKENKSKIYTKFNFFNVSYRVLGKSMVSGVLYLPKDIEKPRVIISIPDYNHNYEYKVNDLDSNLAYLFLILRGHDKIDIIDRDEGASPGYMSENLLNRNEFYIKSIYLDIYKSLDMLRLSNSIDSSAIGLLGKGLGASAAVFTASHAKNVKAIVLDTPSFCYLDLNQNTSLSPATIEINNFISNNRSKKKIIKKNLSYFDSLNFSDKIECSTLMTVGFKDSISPPGCIFALFNHLQCDKTIKVFPDEGNNAGGRNQFKKSIQWLKDILLDS